MAKKIITTIGILIMVILTYSIYISLPETVKISVEPTKTILSVWENDGWEEGAIEYLHLYDGTKKMRASHREIYNYTRSDGKFEIVRIAEWKDNITTWHTYVFDPSTNNVELIPIDSYLQCFNCEGKIVHFEYKIDYEGVTRIANSPESFPHKVKIEWEDGYDWAKVYQNKYVKDKLVIRYRPKTSVEKYHVRLFDPPVTIKNTICKFNEKIIYKNDNTVNHIIGGPKYADDKCTKIEEVASLKDCQFCDNIKLIEDKDPKYKVDVIDYNFTSMSVCVGIGIETGELDNVDIPLQVYDEKNKSKKQKDIKIKLKNSSDKYCTNVPFSFDKEFKFGKNSTTVSFNNTENMADVYHWYLGGAFEVGTTMKWNISSIPANSNITLAQLWMYKKTDTISDYDVRMWRIDNQTWDESSSMAGICGMTTDTEINSTFSSSVAIYVSFNITEIIDADYTATNTFSSIRLEDPDNLVTSCDSVGDNDDLYIGSVTGGNALFDDSESASNNPLLNITYTLPDADGDGVADENDKCPSTNYTAGACTSVNSYGCCISGDGDTLFLQDSTTDNLGDVCIGNNAASCFDSSATGHQLKFNITSIPASSIIDNSTYCFYSHSGFGTLDSDYDAWGIDNETWNEASSASFINSQTTVNTTSGTLSAAPTANSWSCGDVTNIVTQDYNDNEDSSTIRMGDPDAVVGTIAIVQDLNTPYAFGSFTNTVQVRMREHTTTSTRPYLNITYSFEGAGPINNVTLEAKDTTPNSPLTADDIDFNITCTSNGSTITGYVQVYNGSSTFGAVQSSVVSNNTNTLLYTLGNTNTTKTEVWKGEYWCGITGENTTAQNDSVTILNAVPILEAKDVAPTNPVTNIDLTFNITCSESEGETITGYLQKYNNSVTYGALVSQVVSNNTNTLLETLSSSSTTKDDVWTGEFWCGDGYDNSSKQNDTTTIQNSVPSISVSVTDKTINHSENLSTQFTCTDLDSVDTILYYDNTSLFNINSTGGIVDNPVQGNTGNYSILLTCGDGDVNVTDTFTYTILNNAPTIPTSLILNATIYVGQNLIGIGSGSTDADSDAITYLYEFYNVNDTSIIQNFSSDDSYIIAIGDVHNLIRVRAKANDGLDNSTGVKETNITVSNTVPVVNNVTLSPSSPANEDPLVCALNATDADGDSLINTTYWYNDGIIVSMLENLTTISSGNTSVDEEWLCSMKTEDSFGGISTFTNSSSVNISAINYTMTSINGTVNWNYCNGTNENSTFNYDISNFNFTSKTLTEYNTPVVGLQSCFFNITNNLTATFNLSIRINATSSTHALKCLGDNTITVNTDSQRLFTNVAVNDSKQVNCTMDYINAVADWSYDVIFEGGT